LHYLHLFELLEGEQGCCKCLGIDRCVEIYGDNLPAIGATETQTPCGGGLAEFYDSVASGAIYINENFIFHEKQIGLIV